MTKKGLDLTAKEKKVLKIEKEELDRSLRDEIDRIHLIPEPTRIFSVGESIKRGFLENLTTPPRLKPGDSEVLLRRRSISVTDKPSVLRPKTRRKGRAIAPSLAVPLWVEM